MADPIQDLARELKAVKSVGQAREAGRAALKYLADARGRVESGDGPYQGKAAYRDIDAPAAAIQRSLDALPSDGQKPVDARLWATLSMDIQRGWINVAGIEGGAGARVTFREGLSILADAIADAPRVFVQTAGKIVGTTLNEAGKAAGGAVGGILGGIGLPGLVLIAVVVAVVVFSRKVAL